MQENFAPPASDVAEVIREALSCGHTVIIPRPPGQPHSPPSESGASFAMTCRVLFKLAPAESRAFAALLAKNQVSRGELHQAITQDDAPLTDQKGIDVLVHKMRKKLARHNIAVTAIWELGFTIDKATRDRVHKILAEHGVDIAGAATPPDQVDCRKTKPVA